MKSIFLALSITAIVCICSCSKTPPTGLWSGTYVNVLGAQDSFSSVSVVYTGSNTVNVVCKMYQFGYVYTAFTLQNVTLTGNTATFAQKQHIIEATDQGIFSIQGNMSLNGTQLTLNATATNNNSSDTKNYQFIGSPLAQP
jgi:hypothetical protein